MATTKASSKVLIFASLVLALAACCGGVSAKSPMASPPETAATAPAPASDACLTVLYNMSDCLTYVEAESNLTKPDKGCCAELAGLVDSNPICLCKLLSSPNSLGFTINLNRALKLPSVCSVTTPPVSTCAAVGVPVSIPPDVSPSLSPNGSPTSPSNEVPSPSPGVNNSSNEAAATPPGNKNNGNRDIQASALTFIFGLAIVFVSIFF